MAPRAPTTAPAASPSYSAARCRAAACWPTGPAWRKKDRFEGRDLRISTDIRALLKGVLSDHLHVAGRSLNGEVFPGSEGVKGLSLLRV